MVVAKQWVLVPELAVALQLSVGKLVPVLDLAMVVAEPIANHGVSCPLNSMHLRGTRDTKTFH